MNKVFIALIINSIMLSAFASENHPIVIDKDYYIQLNGGLALGMAPKGDFGDKKAGSSGLVGIEAGYQISDQFRTSVSLDYLTRFSFKDVDYTVDEIENVVLVTVENTQFKVTSFVALANIYYDILELNGFTPYIVAGAGISNNYANGTRTGNVDGEEVPATRIPKGRKTNFAFKLGLGTRYSINQTMAFDLHYQFMNLGKIKTGINDDFENSHQGKLKAHQFLLGVVYKF